MPALRVYPANHITQLCIRPTLWAWLMAKSTEANMPPSTYARQRLEELATQDLVKGESEGDLSV